MVVIELDMSCTLARLRSLLCGLSSIALCDDENEGVVYSDSGVIHVREVTLGEVAAIYELIPDGGPAEEASS